MQVEWAEKYRPLSLSEVKGNPKAVDELRKWSNAWITGEIKPKERAIILYGPPGSGKTSAAHTLANDMGWDAIELNASDQRTKKVIERVVGPATSTRSFDGKPRLIIIDEADNIHGTADRGGEKAILNLIKSTNNPIILVANDLYKMSKTLRNACKSIKFRSVRRQSIVSVLRGICKKEGVKCDEDVLLELAEANDLRSAINDLQSICIGSSEVETVSVGERDADESIFQTMRKTFTGSSMDDAISSMYDLDETPEDLILWLDENLPFQYDANGIRHGLRYLSRADVFLGRTRIRQNYGLWRYASLLMTGGVSISERSRGARYRPPSRFRKLSKTKSARAMRDSLAGKISEYCHISRKDAQRAIPFLKTLFKSDEYASGLAGVLRLSPKEVSFLKKGS